MNDTILAECDKIDRDLNVRVVFARYLLRINQKKFAEYLGISQQTYSAFENANTMRLSRLVSKEQALKIEALVGISHLWFIDRSFKTNEAIKDIPEDIWVASLFAMLFTRERRSLGLSKKDLAEVLGYSTGVYISRIEYSKTPVPKSKKEILINIGINPKIFDLTTNRKRAHNPLSITAFKGYGERFSKGESIMEIYRSIKDASLKYNTFFVTIKRNIKKGKNNGIQKRKKQWNSKKSLMPSPQKK